MPSRAGIEPGSSASVPPSYQLSYGDSGRRPRKFGYLLKCGQWRVVYSRRGPNPYMRYIQVVRVKDGYFFEVGWLGGCFGPGAGRPGRMSCWCAAGAAVTSVSRVV